MKIAPLVDYHCHLDLMPDPASAFSACAVEGSEVLTVTTTPLAWRRNCELAAEIPRIRVGLGLHPQLVGERFADLAAFEKFAPEARHIGEVGLDAGPRYRGSLKDQERLFRRVLEICAASGPKILSVHSVRAASRVLDLLESHSVANGRVVFHWFSGSMPEARRAVALGCFFSVNARMACSKNAGCVLREIPLNRILTETDAPFTEDRPGVPTRPGEVRPALELIAALKGVSFDQARVAIVENLKTLETQ